MGFLRKDAFDLPMAIYCIHLSTKKLLTFEFKVGFLICYIFLFLLFEGCSKSNM